MLYLGALLISFFVGQTFLSGVIIGSSEKFLHPSGVREDQGYNATARMDCTCVLSHYSPRHCRIAKTGEENKHDSTTGLICV